MTGPTGSMPSCGRMDAPTETGPWAWGGRLLGPQGGSEKARVTGRQGQGAPLTLTNSETSAWLPRSQAPVWG